MVLRRRWRSRSSGSVKHPCGPGRRRPGVADSEFVVASPAGDTVDQIDTVPIDSGASVPPSGNPVSLIAAACCEHRTNVDPEVQTQVAIEEWMGASPNYTRRLRHALGVTGDTVEDIFKVLQFDVGAPPQFLDFRYSLIDPNHGEFRNDYCGALIDVEPMGDVWVRAMCHTIQDFTFDATAIATNPKARFRPIHRPPRKPADRTPHCHWSVTIEDSREDLPIPAEAVEVSRCELTALQFDPIDLSDDGLGDYTGPLFSDIRFDQWSRSALVRLAEEVAIQHHLLALAFERSVRRHGGEAKALGLLRRQFTGTAYVGSARIKAASGLASAQMTLLRSSICIPPCARSPTPEHPWSASGQERATRCGCASQATPPPSATAVGWRRCRRTMSVPSRSWPPVSIRTGRICTRPTRPATWSSTSGGRTPKRSAGRKSK
ncbi:hypothetical protein [Mycobacterium avium]|uniref:hypothetical protein n=1 Tax=Mycobacterium avium TaxID=1764 RepID=UPI000AE616F5|nr:hypothetical protein [Mycobacterium avium]